MKLPKLTNEQYDKVKQFLLMVVPGASALITGLGGIYGFSIDKITGTIALLAVFAGIALNYVANKYDGGEGK